MALDATKNFAKWIVSTWYDESATSIVLSSWEWDKFPQPSTDWEFNIIWWDSTNYRDPSDDPNVEIVRCTARSTDTLTVTRAQEWTSASTKNTWSSTYLMALVLTSKMIDDIDSWKQDTLTFWIANTNAVKVDSADVADNDFAKFTANGLEGRSYTEVKQDLDLEIGTDIQAYDAGLTDIAGLAVTDGNIIVGDGTNWVAESGATARTSLGLGTGDSPQFTGIELGHASDTTLSRSAAGVLAVEGVNLAKSTMGEDLTTNNYNILRKSIPSADNRGEGDIVTDIVAGETVAFPNLVYLKSDGKWWKADADAIASCDLLGLALESKNADEACKVLLRGFVRDDDWNWTVAGKIYASVTPGGLSQTAVSGEDDVVAIIGYATHADRLYFNPDNTRIEYKA